LREARDVIIRPYLTERATALGERPAPVYTFVVTAPATRRAVARAIEEIYKIRPRRVNIINAPGKRRLVRGRLGRRPGFKKALVYLRAGEKIDFV